MLDARRFLHALSRSRIKSPEKARSETFFKLNGIAGWRARCAPPIA